MFKGFKKQATDVGSAKVGQLIEAIQSNVDTTRVATSQVAKAAYSMESISDAERHALNTAGAELSVALESIAANLGMTGLTQAQIDAGTIAGVLAGDYKGFMSQKGEFPSVSTESVGVVQQMGLADAFAQRSFSLEAYDERENRNAVTYSIAYNMQSARQDEFGETLFPTLTLAGDNVGFGVVVNLMTVYNGIERKITGTFEDFAKKNIIRALADASVLRKEQTRVVPVARAQAADKFVAAAKIPVRNVVLEGETIPTAPLAFGKKVDLIALSQTETLLAGGQMDQTDTLDPAIKLQTVYVEVGNDILKVNVQNLPTSEFTYSTQGNYRLQTLNFSTTSILLNKDTKQADGSALDSLAAIVSGDLIVRVELMVSGTVNIETGETTLFANMVGIHNVRNAAGEELALTDAPASTLAGLLSGATALGYEVQAYRANANVRQRGQLIDTTKYTQLYNVPLRSPIAKVQPINSDGSTDAADLQTLITTTRFRICNEAVTTLLNAAQLLSEYVDARDVTGVGPDVLGTGRFFVRPTYFKRVVKVNEIIASLTSSARAEDTQSVLVNIARDLAYEMYRVSEFKAAADALSGGVSSVPTVIIATDPVLARYFNVTGDLRTLGQEFNVRIVSSLDWRMKGKAFITFGMFDEDRNSQPNPLNFGNLVWAPESVLTANISRGNTISKETVVQPRYAFVTHLPILAEMEISGITQTMDEVVPVNVSGI